MHRLKQWLWLLVNRHLDSGFRIYGYTQDRTKRSATKHQGHRRRVSLTSRSILSWPPDNIRAQSFGSMISGISSGFVLPSRMSVLVSARITIVSWIADLL